MRVIPVLDLMHGRAVWGRGGERSTYRPVRSSLIAGEGEAAALARAFRLQLDCQELYVADLDAIQGASLDENGVRSLCGGGATVLVDAGVRDVATAQRVLALGASRVVIGLETLPSFGFLAEAVETCGRERVVFSLDLRRGEPLGAGAGQPLLTVLGAAVRAGVGAVLVLDLARVGTESGVAPAMLSTIRGEHPALEILAGGGVDSLENLERMARAGCDAALVGTALHTGRIPAAHLARVRRTPGPAVT